MKNRACFNKKKVSFCCKPKETLKKVTFFYWHILFNVVSDVICCDFAHLIQTSLITFDKCTFKDVLISNVTSVRYWIVLLKQSTCYYVCISFTHFIVCWPRIGLRYQALLSICLFSKSIHFSRTLIKGFVCPLTFRT